jgi:hypothetical protein
MIWYFRLVLHHNLCTNTLSAKPMNIIESPRLRAIFKMLKTDLKDSDIPGRTTLSNRIKEMFDEYLDVLETDMKVQMILCPVFETLIICRNLLGKFL